MKICAKCGIDKPYSEFHKYARSADGFQSYCKACNVVEVKRSYAKNPEPAKARGRRYGKEHVKERNAYGRAWRKKNPELARAQKARSFIRNKEKILATKAAWTAKNRGRVNATARAWAARNKENRRFHCATAHSMKRQAVPAWADAEKIKRIYAEARRMELATGKPHDVDHIVPIKSPIVCGLHCEDNLQILPEAENIRKSNRHWPDMP